MKPILFNTEMVKAILEGRKTVTRRVVKEKGWDITGQPKWADRDFWFNVCMENKNANSRTATCHLLKPPYCTGDILYVRETWRKVCAAHKQWINGESFTVEEEYGFQYKADGYTRFDNFFEGNDEFNSTEIYYSSRWYPSIHMPKEAARIFLRVTDVRVERLHDAENLRLEGIKISESCNDCYIACNGCNPKNSPTGCDNELEAFAKLWDSTIKPSDIDKYGWDANPYVWVIKFELYDKEE